MSTWVHADVLTWTAASRIAPRRSAATAPGGTVLVVAHDLSNLTDGVGGPQNPDVLWRVEDAVAPGLTTVRAEVAVRPTAAGNALDTVVRLVREGI